MFVKVNSSFIIPSMLLSTELLAFYRNLATRDFVVSDLETTGFKPPIARVTEISVLHANLKEGIQGQYSTLINSQSEVPYHITRLTGITQDMIDDAPDAKYVWPDYHEHLKSGVLVCHNLDFDYPFMRSELKTHGIELWRLRMMNYSNALLNNGSPIVKRRSFSIAKPTKRSKS